jgi:uncharacterized phage protein (TIGR01671 family)
MNREIKFRVWDNEEKHFLPVAWMFHLEMDGTFHTAQHGADEYGADEYKEVRQEFYTVQLWTGLKDKNGKEIFEGDILQLTHKSMNSCFPLVVRYFEPMARFVLHRNMDKVEYLQDFDKSFETIWTSDMEVIGNILENAALLDN